MLTLPKFGWWAHRYMLLAVIFSMLDISAVYMNDTCLKFIELL